MERDDLRQFRVTIQAVHEEGVAEHEDLFDAPNVLSAIGHACLRFAVKTVDIRQLTVVEHRDPTLDPANP